MLLGIWVMIVFNTLDIKLIQGSDPLGMKPTKFQHASIALRFFSNIL